MKRSVLGALGTGAALVACAGVAAFFHGCGAPDLGDLPALCDTDGVCPDGFSCIHGVCAKPGTPIPTTIASLTNLRDVDLKLVAQSGSALVIWQTYAYSNQGEGFYGVRVTPDGKVSATMALVTSFQADPGALEPYYDVLPIVSDPSNPDTELLLSVAAAPLPGDPNADPSPRLLTYEIALPPQGAESQQANFKAAWSGELRMDTIGYGAVSRPKLALHKNDVALGYFRSLTKMAGGAAKTAGELAVFTLKQDGTFTTGDACGSMSIHPARDGLPVAVGVLDAIADPASDALWWILDDARPSTVRIGGGPAAEAKLERLAVPIVGGASDLTYIQPSARTGEQLPTDPVEGAASLHVLTLAANAPTIGAGGATAADCVGLNGIAGAGGGSGGGGGGAGGAGGSGGMSGTTTATSSGAGGGAPPVDKVLGQLPGLRDSPRPIYIARQGKPALLVSPGTDLADNEIGVYSFDPTTGATKRLLGIPRFATSDIGALGAVIVGGRLYVAWTDSSANAAIIRMGVVPEP